MRGRKIATSGPATTSFHSWPPIQESRQTDFLFGDCETGIAEFVVSITIREHRQVTSTQDR